MKYFPLVWAGLWRKKARTGFTMLSVVVAFLLFGLLQGFNFGMDSMVSNLDAGRLYTSNKYSLTDGLPLAFGREIRKLEGVAGVAPITYFGGFYQNARQPISMFATDIAETFKMFPENPVDPAALEAMARTRTGAIVGRTLAQRFGWKVGDAVPIGTSLWTSKQGSNFYEFQIVGIVEAGTGFTSFANDLLINYAYLDEARQFGNGTVNYFFTHLTDPRRGAEVSRRIDALFVNSGTATATQTEQAFAARQISQVADVGFIVNGIVGAVLFALLFLTGNTLMQSMQERLPELAVLKTLGFSDWRVSSLILAEAAMLCVLSALVGLALAQLIFVAIGDALGPVGMSLPVLALGVAGATGVALLSSALPAVQSLRLSITQALARR